MTLHLKNQQWDQNGQLVNFPHAYKLYCKKKQLSYFVF